jgi:hypothetical protein
LPMIDHLMSKMISLTSKTQKLKLKMNLYDQKQQQFKHKARIIALWIIGLMH